MKSLIDCNVILHLTIFFISKMIALDKKNLFLQRYIKINVQLVNDPNLSINIQSNNWLNGSNI